MSDTNNPWGIENDLEPIEIIIGARGILEDIIKEADFMINVPKVHFEYRFALAVQTWFAIHLVMLMKKNEEPHGLYSMISTAIFLRSLIEVTANINYFSNRKNDIGLGKKFLKTASTSWGNLMAIKDEAPLTNYSWTRLSVAHRVKLISQSGTDYYSVYKYLSSFIHSDAGYMGGMYHIETNLFKQFFTSRVNLCLHNIVNSLERADLLENGGQRYVTTLREFMVEENKKINKRDSPTA